MPLNKGDAVEKQIETLTGVRRQFSLTPKSTIIQNQGAEPTKVMTWVSVDQRV
jgi:hypothetical protein